MAHNTIIIATLVTILSVLSATAQQACQTATPMANVNATQLNGTWFEEVRAPTTNVSCVEINVVLTNNNATLNITTQYAASLTNLYMNQNEAATVNVSDVNANTGFNVVATNGNTTYKILSTDYATNAVLCGYTNASDVTTSFGVILTRSASANYTLLSQLQTSSASVLTNFGDNTAVNITQTGCFKSSAGAPVSVLTAVFAVLYALFKFAC